MLNNTDRFSIKLLSNLGINIYILNKIPLLLYYLRSIYNNSSVNGLLKFKSLKISSYLCIEMNEWLENCNIMLSDDQEFLENVLNCNSTSSWSVCVCVCVM